MKQGDRPARPAVRPADPTEWRKLGALLGEAFQDDPIWTWMCPDPNRRRRHLGSMFSQLIRPRIDAGSTWTTDERSGAAVWAEPGRWKITTSEVARLAVPLLRSTGLSVARSRITALTSMEKLHPAEPHWYLEVLGADPSRRGQGIGSALMQPALERCDELGVPAYLESSNEANVPLYRRHGFEVTGEHRLAPDCPPIWAMWRDAR